MRRNWSIVPRITLRETFTNNVAPSSGVERSDQITEIIPGLHIDSNGARLKWHFDYQLREILYNKSEREDTQNFLHTFGNLEAIENWLFVDFSGIIAQQEISPFAVQSPSNVSINPNRTETSNFRISPYIRGELTRYADYELRYSRSKINPRAQQAPNSDVEDWSGRIKGTTPLTKLGWALEASQQTYDYSNGRETEAERLRALLSYLVIPELKISITGGRESNNYVSLAKQEHSTHGYGFDWIPSPQTQVSAFKENRFFGDAHSVNIFHRTPVAAVHFSDNRDISFLPDQFTTISLGSIYNLMFQQLSTRIPDPVERDLYVNNALQQFGISPEAVVTRGFLASQVSLRRQQQLSFLVHSPRDMLTLSAVNNEHQVLGSLSGSSDIFSTSSLIRQRGYLINFSHRLTPLTSLHVRAAQQDTTGSGGSSQSNELKTFHIGVSTRLGVRTTASLSARRNLFSSDVSPYTENALIGTLLIQF